MLCVPSEFGMSHLQAHPPEVKDGAGMVTFRWLPPCTRPLAARPSQAGHGRQPQGQPGRSHQPGSLHEVSPAHWACFIPNFAPCGAHGAFAGWQKFQSHAAETWDARTSMSNIWNRIVASCLQNCSGLLDSTRGCRQCSTHQCLSSSI